MQIETIVWLGEIMQRDHHSFYYVFSLKLAFSFISFPGAHFFYLNHMFFIFPLQTCYACMKMLFMRLNQISKPLFSFLGLTVLIQLLYISLSYSQVGSLEKGKRQTPPSKKNFRGSPLWKFFSFETSRPSLPQLKSTSAAKVSIFIQEWPINLILKNVTLQQPKFSNLTFSNQNHDQIYQRNISLQALTCVLVRVLLL